jgi:hypothetical protein
VTTYTTRSPNPQEQHRQANTSDQRSLGELFADLSQKASLLAWQEIQLAKIEMKQKAIEASGEIGIIVVGGFLANAALLALVAALILGLAEFMAIWQAAFIVGIGVALIATLLIWKGVTALKKMNPVPEQTVMTLKEDKVWLTRQMNQ